MRRLAVFCVIAILPVLFTCGGSGGGSDKGTYTEANPISPDIAPPYIAKVVALADKKVRVTFSEKIKSDGTDNAANYSIQNSRSSIPVSGAVLDSNETDVILTLGSSMSSGTSYDFNAQNIYDTSGNKVVDGTSTFTGRGVVMADLSDLPQPITNSRDARIKVSGNDVVAYQYAVNNGSWSGERSVSDSIPLTGLSDSEMTVKVVGKDSMGNWQPFSTPTTCQWIVDLTPPQGYMVSGLPGSITNQNSVSARISGIDVAAYKYKLNSHGWSDETDPNEALALDGISDGQCTLLIIARDRAGNWQNESSVHPFQWTVDTTVPTASIEGMPSLLTKDQALRVNVAGDKVTSYKYRLDGSSWSAETTTELPIIRASLSEGTHTIEVIGKNEAGTFQSEGTPTSYSWKIDITPPVAQITATPNAISSDKNPSFTVAGDDCPYFRYKLDGVDQISMQPSSSPLLLSDLSEGVHSIEVRGIDSAGNIQPDVTAAKYRWTVDLTPPQAILIGLPPDFTNTTNGSILVRGSDVVGYKYAIDDGAWSSQIDASTPITFSGLTEGDHFIRVVGYDTAGNMQEISRASGSFWNVDLTPPQAGMTNLPSNPTNDNSFAIMVTGNNIFRYLYSLDGGQWIVQEGSQTLTGYNIPEGRHTIAIKGIDEAGNIQTDPVQFSWTIDMSSPTATFEGLPPAKNNLQNMNIAVGGEDVSSYKISIDGSSYGGETAVMTPVTLSNISAGAHDIAVIGKDHAGNWQATSAAAHYHWVADFTPPTAALSGQPGSLTNRNTTSISVSGDDLVRYLYQLDGSAWSAQIDNGTALTLNSLAAGIHTVAVKGVDSFGNIQDSPTTYSWTVDTTPPSVASCFDSGVTTESVNLVFSWSAPSDAAHARLQIATDPLFNSIVKDDDTIAVTSGSMSFTYTAQESNGMVYYARISHADEAGNWSGYGSASDGITLIGSVGGEVRDSYGAAIGGAQVKIVNAGTGFSKTSTSGSDGKFAIGSIPAGITTYDISITAASYSGATKSNVAVHTGALTDEGMIILVPTASANGTIAGTVVSANDGAKISSATVRIIDFTGAIKGTYTSINGAFTSASFTSGTYSAIISKTGYYDMRVDNIVVNGNKSIGNQALCEKLISNQVRVVLLWGSNPTDLDLHVVGPTDVAVSADGSPNNRFHVYWSNQKSFNAVSGKYSSGGNATGYTSSLVQDCTSGYGPEAINTVNLYAKGVYTFTVHDWSNTDWYQSSPVIRIYDGEGLVQEIPIPTGAGSLRYWEVFQINIQGDTRDTRTINVVNKFATLTYSSKSSMDWQAPQGGVTAYLLSVATGERPLVLLLFLVSLGAFTALFIWNRKRTRNRHENSI